MPSPEEWTEEGELRALGQARGAIQYAESRLGQMLNRLRELDAALARVKELPEKWRQRVHPEEPEPNRRIGRDMQDDQCAYELECAISGPSASAAEGDESA